MLAWLKRNLRKVIPAVVVLTVLAAAYFYGGGSPGLRGWSASGGGGLSGRGGGAASASASAAGSRADSPSSIPPDGSAASSAEGGQDKERGTAQQTGKEQTAKEDGTDSSGKKSMTASQKEAAAAKIGGGSAKGEKGDEKYSSAKGMTIDPSTGKDSYRTDPVPEGKPVPVEPQDAVITDQKKTCTISISCAAIQDNLDWLDPEKGELVPDDGWILKPTEVAFYQGESVFNVLLRTCKQNGIQMEYKNTPLYNSAYIEGIHNLYEFDCGELSGWMYSVDGWFPNYGCSRYQLRDGDSVNWVYTCSLGADEGGYYSSSTN